MEITINGKKISIFEVSVIQMCTNLCDKLIQVSADNFDYLTYKDVLALLNCTSDTLEYKDYLIKGAKAAAQEPANINRWIESFVQETNGDLSLFNDILTEADLEVDLSEKFYNYYTVRYAIEDYLNGKRIAGYITADDVSETLDDFDKWCKTAEDGDEYFYDGIPYTVWEEDPEIQYDKGE